ncbi:HlyC/CorC family transporter [[Clostridium] colinum]|uniref:HlyC/CorC family transporter n=1 Tax=[Clostridium] colinum TaxID=36835 RepID=UPI00202579B4|nr:hemolysin family protein [[Clostridium] colinum]
MDPASFQIIILIILIVLSSFFSMSETALTSISKIRLRTMVDENVKNAKLIQNVLKEPGKLLSAILIGNNLVNIGASSLATSLAIDKWGSKGVGIATGLLTIIILIFGEITPKTFATKNAEKISLLVIKIIKGCMVVFTPIIFVLNIITGALLRILGVKEEDKTPTITESELLTMVNVSHEEGVLEIDEREMINNVVYFANSDAQDVMVPRTDIIAINVEATYEELTTLFKEETCSRMPVYEESIDNIVGIISLKDLLFIDKSKEFSIKDYMREPFFTYESKCLKELFAEMRINRIAMAIILDEYGGTSGIVTLEDMLEEIVGDLADEYDEHDEEIKIIKEDEYIVEGATKIEDVNDMLGTDFKSEDFDSIGGFVIETLGKFPDKGDTIKSGNVKFIIEEIEKNRIEKLRILTDVKDMD